MATTRELITILNEQCKGWNQTGPRGILFYLNQAHKILLQVPAAQRLYFEPSTGKMPFLTTTAGTFNYTLPSNCWRLDKVLVECGVAGSLLDNLQGNDYGARFSQKIKMDYINVSGANYYNIPQIRSKPKDDYNLATVTFTEDPGDTSSVYNLYYYRMPVELSSDSIPHEIEPPWDILCLLPATVKLIEGIQHGNYLEARVEILKTIRPLYWKQMGEGGQGQCFDSEDRGF